VYNRFRNKVSVLSQGVYCRLDSKLEAMLGEMNDKE
jgi:hypothetical protein